MGFPSRDCCSSWSYCGTIHHYRNPVVLIQTLDCMTSPAHLPQSGSGADGWWSQLVRRSRGELRIRPQLWSRSLSSPNLELWLQQQNRERERIERKVKFVWWSWMNGWSIKVILLKPSRNTGKREKSAFPILPSVAFPFGTGIALDFVCEQAYFVWLALPQQILSFNLIPPLDMERFSINYIS